MNTSERGWLIALPALEDREIALELRRDQIRRVAAVLEVDVERCHNRATGGNIVDMADTALQVPDSEVRIAGRWARAKNIRNWIIIIVPAVVLALVAWPIAAAYVGSMSLLFVGLTVSYRRQGRRLASDINRGIVALGRGDLEQAHDIFWRAAETTKLPSICAVARHNLAWVRMRQGKHRLAIATFLDNEERNPVALKALGFSATSAIDIALGNALIGDDAEADKWFAEANKRVDEVTAPAFGAMRIYVSAVIAARRGQYESAARLLADGWTECEATLMGETSRPLRIVRAFAIASTGPRNAGMAEALLALSRPAYPGEYDFLGTDWPEMKAFVDTLAR